MDIKRLQQLAGIITEADKFNFVAQTPYTPMSQTGQTNIGNVTLDRNIKDRKNTSEWGDQPNDIEPGNVVDAEIEDEDKDQDGEDEDNDNSDESNKSKKIKIKDDTVFRVIMTDPNNKFMIICPNDIENPTKNDLIITDVDNTEPVLESVYYSEIPAKILNSLRNAIDEQKRNEKRFEKLDDRASQDFASNLRKAMEVVLDDLEEKTVEGIKRAQIDLNKLMTPMVFLFPEEVRLFIANGGQTNSLSDRFKLTQTKPFEDKDGSSNKVGNYQRNSGGSTKHDD